MKIQYESTIEDVSEPHIRQYLRSSSYRRQRLLEPIWGGVGTLVAFYAITTFTSYSPNTWWIYLIVFALGWLCIFLTIRDTISKRILKYLKLEIGHKLPSSSEYLVSDSKLHCSSLGADIVFNLEDLSSVDEDSERIELLFGDVGLSIIPLRAFDDVDHKESFLQILKREQDAAGNPLPVV